MNLRRFLGRPVGPLVAGFALVSIVSLAIGWTAGTAAASGGTPSAAPMPSSGALPATLVGPALPAASPGAAGAPTTVSDTASIAYPIQGYNQLGAAPEGTILAQGTGTADMKVDGSNRSAALQKATTAALADAHAQAAAVAAAMGAQLEAIYSISTQSSPTYTYPNPDCVVPPLTPSNESGAATGSDGSPGSAPGSSATICVPATQSTPTSAQLVVTLIVAYKFA